MGYPITASGEPSLPRYLEIARAAARQSIQKKQVGAVIVRGGRVLGLGFNREGSCKQTPTAWSRHAEVVAVLDAGDARGSTVYTYRGVHGPRLAKPCSSCMTVLKAAGVKKVVYSVLGGWKRERV